MPEATSTYKLGVDVGGTFTDLFLWSSDGEVETFKVLSTPQDPAEGVLNGLRTIADAKGLDLKTFVDALRTIVHGTTVTTNALLTRRGGRTGLLTTSGVRDALEMRRGIREEQYDNHYCNVQPLVERYLRRPVRGRLDWQGKELEPLALDDVRDAIGKLRDANVEAVAVCFMNAFANADHERAVAELVRAELPHAFLSVSSDVLPTIRFFNRVSTTVLNAYSGPVFRGYIRSLRKALAEAGFDGTLLIMQSSGGVALPEVTEKTPATTLLSGPAAGPKAALAFVRPLGYESCLVVDMGGTSFDACLVQDGDVALKTEGDIDRLRIALPMLDITTIGAGGGSLGWIDPGGLLRMGPESAGADPGPACYGRGGERPACTDANVVLGYLDPGWFAGGKMELSAKAASQAIEEHVANPLGLSVDEAAAGMYRVINANMAHGVREVTVKRGLDPREFPMVVAGGAGALHACMIAQELDIPTLVVPRAASVLCASGMLLTDLQHDYLRSAVGALDEMPPARLDALVSDMINEGRAQLREEGLAEDDEQHEISLDLRYLKQYHEVTVPVTREAIATGDYAEMAAAFHAAHDRLYGYELAAQGTGLELINVRVRCIGRVEKPELPRVETGGEDPSPALKGERRAFIPEDNAFGSVRVYDGHALQSGNIIPGPALIERTDTTILVTGRFRARIDDYGGCVLERTDVSDSTGGN